MSIIFTFLFFFTFAMKMEKASELLDMTRLESLCQILYYENDIFSGNKIINHYKLMIFKQTKGSTRITLLQEINESSN